MMEPSRRRLAAAVFAAPLASGLSGCAGVRPAPLPTAPPARVPTAPQVRPGDRWRYAEINGYNGARIAELDCAMAQTTPRLLVRRSDFAAQPRAEEVYIGAWNVVVEPVYDLIQTFETPLALLPEPVAAGQASWVRTRYRVEGIPTWLAWQERREAVRWERVRVPAGEFDALRIDRRIWFTHADTRRSQSMRTERLWYAPAVHRWVRREWTGQYLGWPIRRGGPAREDWIVHELQTYRPAAG